MARRADRLEALAAEIAAAGGTAPIVIPCDLVQPNSGARIAEALAAAGLEVEYVVNNAGFGLFGRAVQRDRSDQLDMIAVNIHALTDLSLRFSEQLIRHRGGLLNVGSIAGFLPGPGMAVYYASKAYVLSFTEAMRAELAPHGVRVTVLCPGPVPSEFQARAGFKPGFNSVVLKVLPAAVAQQAYRGIDGEQAGSDARHRHQDRAVPASVLPAVLYPWRGRPPSASPALRKLQGFLGDAGSEQEEGEGPDLAATCF